MSKGFGIQVNEERNDLKVQVVRDADGRITRGLVIGDITQQNVAALLNIHPGEVKDTPTVGVGISDIALDNDMLFWRGKIRQALENEGLRIKQFTFNNPNAIYIDAGYS